MTTPTPPPPPSSSDPRPAAAPPPMSSALPPPPTYAAPPIWTAQAKPPRPACPVGAFLLIGGAIVLAIGAFLPWFSFAGDDITGFTGLDEETRDGPVFVGIGAILLGFGITTLVAKRILPIAILAVVFAAFGTLAALVDFSDVQDLKDLFGDAVESGPGLPIVLVGSLIALAGGIVALATRRR